MLFNKSISFIVGCCLAIFMVVLSMPLKAQKPLNDTAKQKKILLKPIALVPKKPLLDSFINTDTIVLPKIIPVYKSDTSHLFYKFIQPLLHGNGALIPIKSLPFKNNRNSDWLFFLATGLVIVVGVLKNFFGGHGLNILQVIFKPGLKNTDANKKLSQSLVPSILLNILFVITFSGFLYYYCRYANFKINYIVIVTLLATMYIGKFFLMQLLTYILDQKAAGKIYLFRFFLVNQVAAMFFTVFIIILLLGKNLDMALVFKTGIVVTAIFYTFRLFYSTLPYRRITKINWLHYVFFICCVELLPLLLIQKTINLYIIK